MKKKGLCLILAALMTIGSLSGCGKTDDTQTSKPAQSEGKSEQANSEQPESKPAESEAEEELEPVTIQLWLGGVGKQKDADRVWEAFNEKLQEYVPNTTVEISHFANAEYGEKFNQMLASGEAVDLAWAANWVTGSFENHIQDGNFMVLDDLLDQYGQGIKESLGDAVLDTHRKTADQNLYYFVSWQGLLTGVHSFRVPTELAELAGDTWLEDTTKIVKKWWNDYESVDDFKAVLNQFDIYFNALKENDKLYAGFDPTRVFNWHYDTHMNSACPWVGGGPKLGVEFGDDTYTVVDLYDTEYYWAFAEAMADFYQKGYIRSDIASVEGGALNFVSNGEYTPNTTVLDSHNHLNDNTEEMLTKQTGVDISTIVVEDDYYIGNGEATTMVIPYCADEPERATMVMNALYTEPELYQLLIYGFEGEHYTDNGDGTITTPYGSTGTSESAYGLQKWMIGSCVNALTTQADTPGMYQEYMEKEKTALPNPFLNFTFDTKPVESIFTSIAAINKEYQPMIMKGYTEDWEATMKEWRAACEAAGIDTLIAEVQRQLDEYIAENGIAAK